MGFTEVDLGFSTADGADIELRHDGADLVVAFTDWRERPVRHVFADVLAFRWGQDLGGAPGDGKVYVVTDSEWLVQEAALSQVPVGRHSHLKLCFNGCGVLDVLTRVGDA